MKPPAACPEALRSLRMKHGLSVRELAKRAGVSPNTIYDWERGGSPRMSSVRAVAECLAEPLSMFLDSDI